MDLLQLVADLDELLDADAVDDYCPNGLQVEGAREVERVVTAVSASRALFTRAVDLGADAVIVHHGVLWKSAEPARLIGSFRERIRLLLANDISLIAYHLPLDRHLELGNAAQLARRLGLAELEPFAEHRGVSAGVCGLFPEPVEADEFFAAVAEATGREPQVFEGRRREIASVGIVTGAAEREYFQAVEAGLDAYITGEATEWVLHQAAEDGVHYIAAGHYATERFGVRALGRWIADRHGLEVEFVDLPNPV
ncbi:MAG: Nif3-like dinuclear metal center hexameric protein [Thermoanaerobaculales bacterium]|jgi:dinuclear metal center YbgI/SA1388 family protein|nr:Nif3-like dinuclear metal center hexameric protein [Thermoanaerobaculales bacterium]